ncbi:STAS domain-containing protein [Kitasatospora sp. NPDC101157]|uniref:STAS domain-containing protein n=1 Tax=Kitasatospora sp. NPDC101157 TaxID=3364098 RepID=UPI00382690A8
MTELHVFTSRQSATLTLHPLGEIDLDTAGCLVGAALAAERGAGTDLAVDLTGVTFIDSSGIHALVTLQHAARDGGGALFVSGAGRQARELLAFTGLADLLGRPADPPGPGREPERDV